jgi:hypothetical protein
VEKRRAKPRETRRTCPDRSGKRYNVTGNSKINSNAATLSGDAAGTTATGGLYS